MAAGEQATDPRVAPYRLRAARIEKKLAEEFTQGEEEEEDAVAAKERYGRFVHFSSRFPAG